MTAGIHEISVDLGDRSYPIHTGWDICGELSYLLPFEIESRTAFILTDNNVATTHAAKVADALDAAGAHGVKTLVLPPGEGTKSLGRLEEVLSWLLDNGVDRRSVLFTVGGGVVGDLGGFAAAIVLRGIPFVQVPTTLLAQVDSSVGGKTGINMPQGKNLVGAFYQPACVLCDTRFLETLPERELKAGYAEIVKYGLINDPEFFIWLEAQGRDVCHLKPESVAKAVDISCRKKAEIVTEDEREGGVRALLNLGHTFGHALEAVCGYDGRLLHGEAVAVGMVLAFQLSARLAHCPEKDADRVIAHLAATGLPTRIGELALPPGTTLDKIMSFMAHDKKAAAGRKTFILVRGIGKAYIDTDVEDEDVRQVILHSMNKD